jgi:glycine/D-amino acid oxidase-like deaminating enzyme
VRLHAPRRLPVLRAGARRGVSRSRARGDSSRGLHNVAKSGRAPLAFDTGPCLRFPNQAQFHPLKYLAGLAAAIERAGGRIYTGTHATKIDGGKDAR